MKCHQCNQALVKEKDGYVCPNCGVHIADEPRKKSVGNRATGGFLLILGLGLAALIFSDGRVLTIADIPIPYGMECVGILSLIFALIGILGVLGIVDVTGFFGE